MNRLENWFCASRLWRALSARQVMPFLLQGVTLGEHVLELGAGAGAATLVLRHRSGRVTALERDPYLLGKLHQRMTNGRTGVLQGDATLLPFADATFSSVVAVLVLHHVETRELQDRLFTEARRVLRPGGIFLALEVRDGLFMRLEHLGDTFLALDPAALPGRLKALGFRDISVTPRSFFFRFSAARV
jgi:ubiquinone/menaquinone biosynthesis C-methylase UbiE